MQSPFAPFQLFRNPFGELTYAERAELAVLEADAYLEWLERSPRAVLQFVGECGHGKSTHLRALQYAWARRHQTEELPGYVYFPEDGQQPALPRSRPLFIDEVQRMGWWRRRQMLRSTGPLVLGTHSDLSRELVSAGFQLRSVDLDLPVSTDRLHEMLDRRIAASRSASTSTTSLLLEITREEVVVLQERFGSNIRAIENHLYIQFQNVVLKGEPWRPAD